MTEDDCLLVPNTMKFFLALAAVCALALATAPELTAETFSSTISGDKPAFIKFYAPWCGHCKKLAPTWDSLAAEVGDAATIASVDCTQANALCQEQGVKGYPTLKFFSAGEKDGAKYAGSRDLSALKEYVKANTNKEL